MTIGGRQAVTQARDVHSSGTSSYAGAYMLTVGCLVISVATWAMVMSLNSGEPELVKVVAEGAWLIVGAVFVAAGRITWEVSRLRAGRPTDDVDSGSSGAATATPA